MEHLDKIMEMAVAEMNSIAKNGKFRSREEIDSVGKLIDMTKDIYCIWEMEENEYADDGASYARDGMRGYSENRYGGSSYARGRGRSAKRDSLGRYSRNDGYRMDGYSRDDGKGDFVDDLHEIMRNAPDEQTRQSIKRMIEQMEHS